MIKISSLVEVYDVKNAPDFGALLVVQPDYYNAAFRTEPTFEKIFPTQADALNFIFNHIGKTFFGITENKHLANIIAGGTSYVDIVTSDAIRKTFRVEKLI